MCFIKVDGYPPYFSIIFTKGNNFCDVLFAYLADIAFVGFTLKGKNLLLLEQIHSFKSKLFFRRETNM